jgi:hypothetical protein
MNSPNPLLEISGDKVDGGELVGRRPSDVPSEFLYLNFSAQNPMKAIRAKCIDCCCGNAAEVRKCVATDCDLWPFRLGSNPFRKRSTLSEDEKQRRAAQLKRLDSGDQPSHWRDR